MLVARTGEQHAGVFQRGDHGLIGVAELALVVDDPLALEARRVLGEKPASSTVKGILVSICRSLRAGARLLPDLEVLGAVARSGVDEAGAGILGDMLAGQQRHVEIVAYRLERVRGAE